MWSARSPQERTVATLVGAVRLRRPYVDGVPCPWGTSLLDQGLQLTERRQPADGQKAVVNLTKALPDETAGALFEELPGLPLSAPTAHEVPQRGAEGLTVLEVAPSREDRLARIAAVAIGQTWWPLVGLAMDGAAVPTRPATAQTI